VHFTHMPLFILDLKYGDDRTLENEMLWFPDVETAEGAARDIGHEIIRRLGFDKINIAIHDQHRRLQKELVVSS